VLTRWQKIQRMPSNGRTRAAETVARRFLGPITLEECTKRGRLTTSTGSHRANLCVNDPENSHLFAHDFDTQKGAVLKRADFKSWNG
jgi:hypothetical protein